MKKPEIHVICFEINNAYGRTECSGERLTSVVDHLIDHNARFIEEEFLLNLSNADMITGDENAITFWKFKDKTMTKTTYKNRLFAILMIVTITILILFAVLAAANLANHFDDNAFPDHSEIIDTLGA